MRSLICVVFSLAVVVTTYVDADPVTCGQQLKNNGTFGVPGGANATEPCQLTISRDASSASQNSVLKINNLVLAVNDILNIYDGPVTDDTKMASFSSKNAVAFQVLVGFQVNTTIVFTPAADNSKSRWSIDYNTEECSVNVVNPWLMELGTPTYLKKESKSISCTYNVDSTALALRGRFPVVSVSDFTLKGTSSITFTSADESATYQETNTTDDFFASGSDLSIQFNIMDTKVEQGFSLILMPVVAGCSGAFMVNNTSEASVNITDYSSSYECRWKVSTNLTSVHVNVASLSIDTSGDKLVIQDGGSISSPVLQTFTDSSAKDVFVASTKSSVIISLTLGNRNVGRTLHLNFAESDIVNRVNHEGSLYVENVTSDTVVFQLVAAESQWVKVQLNSNLPENATLTMYNGLQMSDPVWVVLTSQNADLKTVIGGPTALLVLSNAIRSEFNATFTSIPAGCDMLAPTSSDQLSFVESAANQTCTWTLAPQNVVGEVAVNFDTMNLGEDEMVSVYSGLAVDDNMLVTQFNGPKGGGLVGGIPQLYAAAKESLTVVIKTGKTVRPQTSLSLRYAPSRQACGGQLTSEAGEISSPNYPNQYPLNAHCLWTPNIPAAKILYISFTDLNMAQDHYVAVNNGTETMAKYGGFSPLPDDLPADLVLPVPDVTDVEFHSARNLSAPVLPDVNQVGGGAKLKYWLLACGGNVTGKGSFSSDGYPAALTKDALCVWSINVNNASLPKDNTNIVRFNLSLSTGSDPVGKYLTIFDGQSQRYPTLATNTAAVTLSRYDTIFVLLNYTAAKNATFGFNLTFNTYTCNSSQLCDNGVCLHDDWRCDHIDQCKDNSDEKNCTFGPTPKPIPEADYSGWVKSGWVPGCLFIGILLGAVLVFLVPRIVRRFRGGAGNYSRMDDNRAL